MKSSIAKLESEKKELESKLQSEKKEANYWEYKASELDNDLQVCNDFFALYIHLLLFLIRYYIFRIV